MFIKIQKITLAVLLCSVVCSGLLAINLLPAEIASMEESKCLDKITFMWGPKSDHLSITQLEKCSGNAALEVKTKTPDAQGIYVQANGNKFKKGETYSISAYLKSPQNMGINIFLYTMNNKWKDSVDSRYKHFTIGQEWVQYKITEKLTKDANILGMIIKTPDSGEKTFYVDELKIELESEEDTKSLSSTEFPANRVFNISNPEYGSLVKKTESVPRWHLTTPRVLSPECYSDALKYGVEYSPDAIYASLKSAGIHVVCKNATDDYKKMQNIHNGNFCWVNEKPDISELLIKYNSGESLKPVLEGYYNLPGKSLTGDLGMTRDADGFFGWLPDPINQQTFSDSVDLILKKYGQSIKAVFVGDEQFILNHNAGLKCFTEKHNQTNPTGYLAKADAEVKMEYGFGKFDIPCKIEKTDPEYPFYRRAYVSWLHDKLRKVNAAIRKDVKARFPEMPVISDDAYGVPSLHGVQFWHEYADVGVFQLGEGGDSGFDNRIETYAFKTKMVKDLSGVGKLLLLPHDCDSGYPSGGCSTQEMNLLYSQILKAGGDGFLFWPASMGGMYKPKISTKANVIGYPAAWQYMIEVTKLINNMGDIKFPVADTAIFISDESLKCDSDKFYRFRNIFTLLGSRSGCWFDFISDTMLESGRADLSKYKVIYLPYIKYTKQSTINALKKYVDAGGTLVCCDPQAFEFEISSEHLTGQRTELFGIELSKQTGSKTVEINSMRYPVDPASAWQIKQFDKNTRIIALYNDNTPAIVEKQTGKGKTIFFAFSPLENICLSSSMDKYFKELQYSSQCRTDLDIWRFKLPDIELKPVTFPKGKCLTNNFAYWNNFKFINDGTLNFDTQGSYEIQRGEFKTKFKFSEGKLTDRRNVFSTHQLKSEESTNEWIEEIDSKTTATITFDLEKIFKLNSIKMYYSGTFSKLNIAWSMDRINWQTVSEHTAETSSAKSVSCMNVNFPEKTEGRYVKLTITPDAQNSQNLIIAETEIWGE